ncbi:hypothetical protein PoB_006578000 [Plakobranchus ocellatus]|uniref:Uncharacterized protein n=1 Tax=Plakobranchus ocellatus TaxID=259542 RepID=A0AAV4D5A5_9GAST|nr:hypothetical protein PoB_006578000 [Plakobranchus ocellatus]
MYRQDWRVAMVETAWDNREGPPKMLSTRHDQHQQHKQQNRFNKSAQQQQQQQQKYNNNSSNYSNNKAATNRTKVTATAATTTKNPNSNGDLKLLSMRRRTGHRYGIGLKPTIGKSFWITGYYWLGDIRKLTVPG